MPRSLIHAVMEDTWIRSLVKAGPRELASTGEHVAPGDTFLGLCDRAAQKNQQPGQQRLARRQPVSRIRGQLAAGSPDVGPGVVLSERARLPSSEEEVESSGVEKGESSGVELALSSSDEELMLSNTSEDLEQHSGH